MHKCCKCNFVFRQIIYPLYCKCGTAIQYPYKDVPYTRQPNKINVGFLTAAYCPIGGTEVWHQTLIPNLPGNFHPTGMAVTAFAGGDDKLLPCPVRFGREAALELSSKSDILICFGISDIREFIQGKPKIVNVHHADLNSQWANDIMKQTIIDVNVAINPEVARVYSIPHIPNAINPARIALGRKNVFTCLMCGMTSVWAYTKSFIRECPGCRVFTGNRVAAEYQINTKKVVLWCGRFVEDKRPQLVAEVAKIMSDYLFIMVGDGPVKVPSDHNLRIIGAQPNQADWLSAADLFLSTPTFEGFGLAMAEAMASQVPVLATPYGLGATKYVHKLPPNPTPEEIRAAVRTSDRSKVLSAYTYIMKEHSITKVITKWNNLLSALVA